MNYYQKLMKTNPIQILIQFLIQLTVVVTVPSSLAAVELRGLDRLEYFKCDFYSPSGRTEMIYYRDHQQNTKTSKVNGIRNGLLPVEYNLNSLGEIHSFLGLVNYITLSSESQLPKNQYLTMVFNNFITSDDKSATGTLYLVQGNGMVFLPATMGMVPVGTFYCSEITVSKSKMEIASATFRNSSGDIYDSLIVQRNECDENLKE